MKVLEDWIMGIACVFLFYPLLALAMTVAYNVGNIWQFKVQTEDEQIGSIAFMVGSLVFAVIAVVAAMTPGAIAQNTCFILYAILVVAGNFIARALEKDQR